MNGYNRSCQRCEHFHRKANKTDRAFCWLEMEETVRAGLKAIPELSEEQIKIGCREWKKKIVVK